MAYRGHHQSRGPPSRPRDDRQDLRQRGYNANPYDSGHNRNQNSGYHNHNQNGGYHNRGGYGQGRPGNNRGGRQYVPPNGGRGGHNNQSARVPSMQGGIYLENTPAAVPDPGVTALEDSLVLATRGRTFTIAGAEMPGRQGYGTQGRPIVLRTNYLTIEHVDKDIKAQISLHRYEVDLSPSETPRGQKRRMLEVILQHPKFKHITYATDYASIIVTTSKIDIGAAGWTMKDVPLHNTDPPAAGSIAPTAVSADQTAATDNPTSEKPRGRTFAFTLKYNNTYSLHELLQYMQNSSAGAMYATADMIQLLNIIMLQAVNAIANVTVTARNKAFPYGNHPGTEAFDLQGGLQALRGYFSSVRPTTGRVLLNLNVCSGAFYRSMVLPQLINARAIEHPQQTKQDEESFIRRLKVKISYIQDGQAKPYMERTKTIFGYAERYRNAHDMEFSYVDPDHPLSIGRWLSIKEYFKRHHKITLRQPELPVLNCGSKEKPQYIPQELCTVLPGQQYRRLLSAGQTTLMLGFAARAPNANAMSIAGDNAQPGMGTRLLSLNAASQPKTVNPFGVQVGTSLITVPGRVLDAPRIEYGGRSSEQPRDGSWRFDRKAFLTPANGTTWTVMLLNEGDRNSFGNVDDRRLMHAFDKALGGYGLHMQRPNAFLRVRLSILTHNNRETNSKLVDKAFGSIVEAGVKFVLVILPKRDEHLYARIKYYGDTVYGIPTQCSVGSKFAQEKGQGMYFGNLALKINIKLGGVNHSINNLFRAPLDNNTMIVGIDVTHPSPGSAKNAPSIACVVASTDAYLGQWPGSIRRQRSRQETISGANNTAGVQHADTVSNLEDMVCERLELWRKLNKSLPTQILVYRDGVSESQYSLVLTEELPSFHRAFGRLYGSREDWPKVSIIVVGKRHHTRFYPTNKQDADCGGRKPNWNPLPGTIVDRGISGRVLQEFWLQAHQGLQGSARSAHYVVIKDDIQFEPDELYRFTHSFCYMFSRATKAVSVCPAVYYADLLAERGRTYMFSTMAEGSNGSVYSEATSEWNGSIHPALRESTWYI